MTLIEVLFFVWNCVVATLVGTAVADRFGLMWGVIAALVGFFLTFAAVQCAAAMIHVVRPLRPRCKNGRCKASNYSYVETTSDGDVFQCRCGDRYLQAGSTFRILQSDGSKLNYQTRGTFGSWRPDADTT